MRSQLRRGLFLLASLTCALPLLACLTTGGDEEPIGEAVGSYLFTETLLANECGFEAAPVLDMLQFRAELRNRGGQAIWRRPSAPAIYGTVTDGVWAIQTSQSTMLYEGCAMTQREIITLTEVAAEAGDDDAGTADDAGVPDDAGQPDDAGLSDAGSSDAGLGEDAGPAAPQQFTGTHSIRITPDVGSNCSPSLVSFGGPFPALPCEVRYDVVGEPTDPLFE